MMRKYIVFIYILLILLLLCCIFFYFEANINVVVSQYKKWLIYLANAFQITTFSLAFFLSSLGISFLAFLIEILFVGWKESALKRTIYKPNKSAMIDNICYLLNITKLFKFFTFILTFGVFYLIISVLKNVMQLNLGDYIPNKYLQFFTLFVFADFVHYFRHRFDHWGPMWELHNYHHSAKEFNIITNTRGGYLEAGINSLAYSIIYFIGGVALEPIIGVLVARELIIQINHSNIKSTFGIIGKYILITPLDHKLHHSIHQEDYDKNFGAVFKWWDVLFRTYKKPTQSIEIGIEDVDYHKENFIQGQFLANKRFFQRISARLGK